MKKIIQIGLLYFLFNLPFFATTWDEPWQEKVIKESDTFAKIKVISTDEQKGVKAVLIKNLAGEKLTSEIVINNFYFMNLTTLNHEHLPGFYFKESKDYYVFLKQGDDGNYMLPTPTSGWADMDSINVFATYRHSYSKAIVPIDMYENSMTAKFNRVKNLKYDKIYIDNLINTYLNIEPSSPVGSDMSSVAARNFFLQHVALECVYYFGDTTYIMYYDKLLKFINFDFYHTQVSAIRALSSINTKESRKSIFEFLKGKGDNFSKVIAVWSLEKMNATECKNELAEYFKNASTEEVYFDTDIMDPRVGTYFPKSVKNAVQILLKKWK